MQINVLPDYGEAKMRVMILTAKLPCAVEDVACFNKANKEILELTTGGIPRYGLKAIDPLVIPYFKIVDGNNDTIDLKNVKIVGFKNMDVTQFNLDRAAKKMTISSKVNLKIDFDGVFEFPKQFRIFSAKYDATTGALLTIIYNYELKTDEQGAQHLHIVDSFIECESADLHIAQDPKLIEAVKNDPEFKVKVLDELTEEETIQGNKLLLCTIIKKGFETLTYNTQMINNYYPVTTFFSNF